MSIQQRVRERDFDNLMQAPANTVAAGVVPNIVKALRQLEELQAALAGEYSDMAARYAESVAPISGDILAISEKSSELLAAIIQADENAVADPNMGAVYPTGFFRTYQPDELEGEE